MDLPLLAPADVGPSDAAAFRLGGRVLAVSAGALEIGDAIARVALRGDLGLVRGDLVVVEVVRDGDDLRAARLVRRDRPARPDRLDGGESARLVGQGVGARLVARAMILSEIRSFFDGRGFLEVETPARVPCPGLDLHLDALPAGQGTWGPAWLATSPEYQMKRLLAGGMPRIYQIARVFRGGEQGALHAPEFTMLEWYRAFADAADVMAETEELIAAVASGTTGDATFTLPDGASVPLEPPFERIAVGDAFARFAGVPADDAIALAGRDEDRFFRLLVDAVEPGLRRLARPVFLCDWPVELASLARASPSDPRVAERFELCAGGVELCNGFGELTDPVEQRRRFERDRARRAREGKPVYAIDERFLAALEEGMPPAAGNALGVDRLVMLCTGEAEIARVMAFDASRL